MDSEVGATDSNYNDEESGQTAEPLCTDADLDKEFCELSAIWDADDPRSSTGGGMLDASSTAPELHVQPGSPDESIGEAALSHVQQQLLLWREQQAEAQPTQMELVEAEVTENADIDVRRQAELERICVFVYVSVSLYMQPVSLCTSLLNSVSIVGLIV